MQEAQPNPSRSPQKLTGLPATAALLAAMGLGLPAALGVVLAEVRGTEGDDVYSPEAEPDTPGQFVTTDDDDRIEALGGNDVIRAGGGNDRVFAGEGDDTVFGGPGGDTIDGDGGNDTIHGEDNSDFIRGGDGDDTIHGGHSNDILQGNAGDDAVHGDDGDDQLDGGDGDDLLRGGAGDDTLLGGAENDGLFGGEGEDELDGGDGFDYLDGGGQDDLLDGGMGSDIVIGRGGVGTLAGGPGDDYLVIVGSDLAGYLLFDNRVVTDRGRKQTNVNAGTDMICFVDEVSPEQMRMRRTNSGAVVLELAAGAVITEDIELNLPELPALAHFEAFRTGDGNDTIVGRDLVGLDSYAQRFTPRRADRHLRFDEVFFTGGGDDTVTTGLGDDLVCTGEGNDTIRLGPGAHYVVTGGGRDTIHLDGDDFDGSEKEVGGLGRCRIADLSSEDKIIITDVDPDLFTLMTVDWAGTTVTKVVYDRNPNGPAVQAHTEEFDLIGIRADQVIIDQRGRDVEFSIREGRRTRPRGQ